MARAKELPEGWDEKARQIGIRLQRARQALDLSQEEVAHRAGISAYTYQKFEKGESKPGTPLNPRLTTLLALCDALQVSLHHVVND
ncbi:helix-turn-helix domain-containing protein [Rudaeicoccus suwonensis]|uniref:Helix-turn-helix protein n=1 Tax=Rudaeicoccus suwonensis TaxID=657409 RepID=A0A561EAE5_9MICO|nr:helix-turn-helix transcriptional regulator [Rudaeicoccus suwonensis]TWE12583.1 helix-turn-helix protein [Rudaeicoccus suwonensis]